MLEVRPIVPGVLQVIGPVDLSTAKELREKLTAAVGAAVAAGSPMLTLDLSGAELVDASGLGVLLGAHRRARRGGTRLRLVRLTPEIRHLLLVSRLYRVLDVEPGNDVPTGSGAPSAALDRVPEPRGDVSQRRRLTSS